MINITTRRSRRGVVLFVMAGLIVLTLSVNQTERFRTLEQRLFDRFLSLLPAPEGDPDIRVIGIDDRAIEAVGEWPWSRAVLADGVAALAEFGPEEILLDIELSESSPLLVERQRWSEIEARYLDTVPRAELDALVVDRDARLADTMAALGTVSIPVTVEERETIRLRTALPVFRAAARSEGFSNLEIDRDGVSRRIDLVREVDNRVLVQLGVAALGMRPDSPDELRFDDRGRLRERRVRLVAADGEATTVPLTPEGHVLVRWPEDGFAESYRGISWVSLIEYLGAMEDLEFNLRLMRDAGYLDGRSLSVIQTADAASEALAVARETGDAALFDEYRQLRRAFVALAGSFLQGGSEERVEEDLDAIAGDAPPALVEQIDVVRDDVRRSFAASRAIYEEVVRLRGFLEDEVAGSVSLIGYTATSTIDLGVTPFDESSPNLGLHAAMISMVGRGDFIDEAGWHVSAIVGTAWMALLAFLVGRSGGTKALARSIFGVLIPPVVVAVLFLTVRLYLPVVTLTVPGAVAVCVVLAGQYLTVLRDHRVIRSTFEHYLAPEVINELIEDPERIGVGGREETLTALFTDITGFSRVSEILGTSDLVSLLNEYLTAMSDVVLDHRGTIDKYEGDAIMAFFGAPVPDENHAEQACRSAIQMKKLEALLNDRMIRNGTSPQPLLTRIGINSGPMIVGNLGTTRRLNYTIMGPAVNLASRLEGVNKPYRTAICIGERTRELLPEGFLLRRMDRVRVKGTDEPVRLYELIGYGDESSAPQREALELFERGLADFEVRSWEKAARRFETVLRIYPDDGPATLFLERCREFMEQEPRDTWDGVISLTAK